MTRPEHAKEVEQHNDARLAAWADHGSVVLLGYRYEKDGRPGAIGYCHAFVTAADGEALDLFAHVTENHTTAGKAAGVVRFKAVPRRRDGVELPAWRPVAKETAAAAVVRLAREPQTRTGDQRDS